MAGDMLFQCYIQRLFSVDEHIVLFAGNQEFDYDHFELADMDNKLLFKFTSM